MKGKEIKIRTPASFFAGLAQQKRMLPSTISKKKYTFAARDWYTFRLKYWYTFRLKKTLNLFLLSPLPCFIILMQK